MSQFFIGYQATLNFYASAVSRLLESGIPFMIGGAFAMKEYAGIVRDTKDLDIFCKPSDYQAILQVMIAAGYHVEIKDPEWIAKVFEGEAYIDIIFSSRNRVCIVDELWFEHAIPAKLWELNLHLVPPEEMIWSKAFVMERERFDGADINHIILHHGSSLDWRRILTRMGTHWEVLLATLIQFHFVYPTERRQVPDWLFRECLSRMEQQLSLPVPQDKICRGTLLGPSQYQIDLKEWGFQP